MCPSSRRRQLRLSGSRNLRDLGGYRSAVGGGGREVRWGRLYRSGHLGDLTPESQRRLKELGIATVIDFRTPEEREQNPSRLGDDHRPRVLQIPVDPGSQLGFSRRLAEGERSADTWVQIMEDMNRSLVRDHARSFRRMFEVLGAASEGAHVLHCASGKDRTGTGAALLLAALGVDRSTIVEDFLLTNTSLELEQEVGKALKDYGGPASRLELPAEQIRPIFEVRPSYLLAAFDEIDRELGGIDVYLSEQMRLDANALAQLHDTYLCENTTDG
jgi:protein-tyrosine phosphatase